MPHLKTTITGRYLKRRPWLFSYRSYMKTAKASFSDTVLLLRFYNKSPKQWLKTNLLKNSRDSEKGWKILKHRGQFKQKCFYTPNRISLLVMICEQRTTSNCPLCLRFIVSLVFVGKHLERMFYIYNFLHCNNADWWVFLLLWNTQILIILEQKNHNVET